MNKKDDLPAMPFYVGDWLKAPDIQALPYELKGVWFEMLCYMWESKERGYLLYSKEELSRLLRLPEVLLEQKLEQLLSKSIYSVRESDGAIYSRRMVRDQKIREIRTKVGALGGRRTFAKGFAKAKQIAKDIAKCENENENENENESEVEIEDKNKSVYKEQNINNINLLVLWNEFAQRHQGIAKIEKITKSRGIKLKERIKEGFDLVALIPIIEEQTWLLEGNPKSEEHKNWRVSLDWLIANDTNWVKVIERKYKNESDHLPASLRSLYKS